MRILLYNVLLTVVVVYAFVSGRRPERIGATVMLVGTILTRFAWSAGPGRFAHVEIGVLAVDIGAFVAWALLAIRTNRNWTLWLAAFQLVALLGHLAKLIDPGMLQAGYAFLLMAWSYPMLLTILLGTRTQQKRRRAAAGEARAIDPKS